MNKPLLRLAALLGAFSFLNSVSPAFAGYEYHVPVSGLRAIASAPPFLKQLQVSLSALNLGSIAVGRTSSEQVLTLTNTGTGPLSLSGITVTTGASDFYQSNNCPATLAESQSCATRVTLMPSTTGALVGALTVTSDAPGSPKTISLEGTGLSPTYATWSASDKNANLSLTGNDLVAVGAGPSAGWYAIRATQPKTSGKYVFELKASIGSGYVSCGFESTAASLAAMPGTTDVGLGLKGGSSAYTASNLTATGTASGCVTTTMFALDLSAGKGWIAQGGTWVSGDPAAGSSPSFTWTPGTTIAPAAAVYGTYTYRVTANFGASAFTNPVPLGFVPGWY